MNDISEKIDLIDDNDKKKRNKTTKISVKIFIFRHFYVLYEKGREKYSEALFIFTYEWHMNMEEERFIESNLLK